MTYLSVLKSIKISDLVKKDSPWEMTTARSMARAIWRLESRRILKADFRRVAASVGGQDVAICWRSAPRSCPSDDDVNDDDFPSATVGLFAAFQSCKKRTDKRLTVVFGHEVDLFVFRGTLSWVSVFEGGRLRPSPRYTRQYRRWRAKVKETARRINLRSII